MNDLVERSQSLQLTECEEKEFIVSDEDTGICFSPDDVKLCLVAKVLSNRKINFESFKYAMKTIWRVNESTRIEVASSNVFVIQFRSMMDKRYVLMEGPWTFDRAIILMKQPQANDNLANMTFNETSMWVQIHNVPFKCMTRAMAKFLGTSIGNVEEIECDDGNKLTGPFMRLRVTIDISKPLRRGVKVKGIRNLTNLVSSTL